MSLATLPVTEIPRQPLPEWPQGWYVVGRARDLRAGQLLRTTLAQQEIVVFRTASGALGALDAHCPHMGAHLGLGKVRGEHLECGLHCWRIGVDGAVAARPEARRAQVWRVRERAGLVMLEFGGEARATHCRRGGFHLDTHAAHRRRRALARAGHQCLRHAASHYRASS